MCKHVITDDQHTQLDVRSMWCHLQVRAQAPHLALPPDRKLAHKLAARKVAAHLLLATAAALALATAALAAATAVTQLVSV